MSPQPELPPERVATERLVAPLAWWLLGTGFVLSLGIAVFAFLGPVWGIGVTVGAEGVVAAVLVGYGSTTIEIGDDGIRVGRAQIGYTYVRRVEALDAASTLERLRTRANPAAYLVVRPYVRTSLEITLDDPADPHPYWLVSSRYADRLAGRANVRLAPTEATEATSPEPAGG